MTCHRRGSPTPAFLPSVEKGLRDKEAGQLLADNANEGKADHEKVSPPSTSTVYDWKKAETTLRKNVLTASDGAERQKTGKHPELDEALTLWAD